ncbi:hypothetical protein V6N13_106633 [Hibiscus sabdariffa]
MPGDSFKVLPLRTDADCLNIVVELPRNHHVHIYLVEIDESVGPQAEPFVETEYEFEEPSPYSEIGPEFESQVELVVAVLVEPFEPQDEPPFIPQREPVFVAQTKPFETQDEPPFAPQTELVVATQTDSSDTEYLGSTTESESSFEDSDYSVEDIEEVVQSLFTDTSCKNQFRTHFEEKGDASEIRVESDNETEYADSLHSIDESDSNSDGSVRKKRFLEFNAETDMENPELKVGILFANREGYHKGHLLAAIGIDAKDCLYLITFAVVESECHESWYWFLELLATDLELNNSHNISFMPDRHKIPGFMWTTYPALCELDRAHLYMQKVGFDRLKQLPPLCLTTSKLEHNHCASPLIKRSSHGTWKQPAPAISAPTLQDQTNTSAPAQQGSTQPPPIQVVRWMLNNSQESSTTQPPTHL